MPHTLLKLITAFIAIATCLTSKAQVREEYKATDTLEIYFHQGKHEWRPEFKDNGKRMEEFIHRFQTLQSDNVFKKITKIHIIAGCSPEGIWAFNQRLSRNRAKEIRKVLAKHISLPDSLIVEHAIGINWEGLRKMAEDDQNLPHREEVLDIIDNSPELFVNDEGKTMELRKVRLMWRFDGKAWDYMYEHYFPILRSFNLQIVIEWEHFAEAVREELGLPEMTSPVAELQHNPYKGIINTPPRTEIPKAKPAHYFAIKTNTLYDALLTPNIGVEFYLGKRFSLAADWHYAWWKRDPISWYHRTYGGDIELRKYFGTKSKEKPLQGWHAGLYGQILTYDFDWGARGYLADRWSYACGASLGYSVPVRHRLNIDFTLGVGYMWGEYKEYLPIDDCYVWQVTKQRRWIGPTRFEISLVWQLGRGNVNEGKKGGRR